MFVNNKHLSDFYKHLSAFYKHLSAFLQTSLGLMQNNKYLSAFHKHLSGFQMAERSVATHLTRIIWLSNKVKEYCLDSVLNVGLVCTSI